ncbi:interferon-induced protein with tetratricopeptide repeats 1-like isoform X2 [Pteronotus mesoamericanus]|uniref:interferon-induced protein with tetratricopeptide repeats 1-like isoform X1 n=1 Tax=Pteronotus mesoamericanus TaxID=1884717 RepID=UPI0023ECB642|nr:interferon-induced protein with tetratricopeptide repeats 1-like isoform X1 [Pteronotus parnellii mesoamericanus]XP_054428791.1 interferon-induced protein with tetratricopeptide repeats 1-like isoform X2 [Pteronotus parnellii mesoamericanus]
MSKSADEDQVKDRLQQLRCHFTWKLVIEDAEVPDLENRVFDEIDFLDTKFNVAIHNLLAYVKHLTGQNKEALQSLKAAEDLIQTEHARQSDVRRLVTWGNYAWLYYHMGRLAEAQIYLDKVENTCKQLASPSCYTVESPEMDCEEGWALLKCGGKNYERAKACFEKALEVDPENPEFNTGYAIAVYRLEGFNTAPQTDKTFCLHILKRAIRLNPEDAYMKALLALTFQDIGQEAEGEKYIEEALSNKSSQTYVFRYAAKFYRRKGSVDKALHFLNVALRATPCSAFLHHQAGLCYRSQIFQIKKATKGQPRGRDREHIDRVTKLAISHLEFALEQKPTMEIAYIHLADMYSEAGNYSKAEDAYKTVLSMKSYGEEKLQEIYFKYGRFKEFQRKSEDDAIISYLKAITIEKPSFSRDKSLSALEKLVLKKLQTNEADIENLSILGFVYKSRGEMNKALEYYEQALRLAAGF